MAQLTYPTHKDWVSQVLEDIEYLSIELEIEDIKTMKKECFKKIVKEAVRKNAFIYSQERKESRISENAKGKKIVYEEFAMSEYLSPNEEDLTIEEQKWLISCRVEDIHIKSNHRWKHNNIFCQSCKKNEIENQRHLLYCDFLLGKNYKVTYIPDYDDLYHGNLSEQIYVSRLLRENYCNRVPDN